MAGRRRSDCRESNPPDFGRPVRGTGKPEWRRPRRVWRQPGARMKTWIKTVALLCICCVCASAQSAQPKWKVDLTERYGFQAFDRTINFYWTLHQGLLFISPERVLVYQVNHSRGATKLAPRDSSGGSGNFILTIRILNTAD